MHTGGLKITLDLHICFIWTVDYMEKLFFSQHMKIGKSNLKINISHFLKKKIQQMIHFYNMGKFSKDLVANLHLYCCLLPTGHSPRHRCFFSDAEAQGTLPFTHLCSPLHSLVAGEYFLVSTIWSVIGKRKMSGERGLFQAKTRS